MTSRLNKRLCLKSLARPPQQLGLSVLLLCTAAFSLLYASASAAPVAQWQALAPVADGKSKDAAVRVAGILLGSSLDDTLKALKQEKNKFSRNRKRGFPSKGRF